jgi:hypothetical protein
MITCTFYSSMEVQSFVVRIHNNSVRSVLMYGSECWKVTATDIKKCETFQKKCETFQKKCETFQNMLKKDPSRHTMLKQHWINVELMQCWCNVLSILCACWDSLYANQISNIERREKTKIQKICLFVCLFVCLFWVARAIFQLSGDCHHCRWQGCKFRPTLYA